MALLLTVVAIVLGGFGQGVALDGPAPVLKRTIALEGVGGRLDHLAFEPSSGRLFVAALGNGSVEVIDLEKGARVSSITGLKEPQGIAYVPATKQVVVACGGDGTVRAYDAGTLEMKIKVEVGEDADNVRLSAEGQSVVVGYGAGALAVLSAADLHKTGQVKLSGHPESFQIEPGTQRVFINVPGGLVGGGGEVVAADLGSHAATATWVLKEAGRNFPMALDGAHKRLYVGCRRPARLLVLDTESGRVVASPECVGDADDVFVDAKSGRVMVIGGDGAVDVFESKEEGAWVKSASVRMASGARTGLFVPERRALYVAVPKRGGAEIREYGIPD